MKIPNLFLVGAAKSGTTSIYHYLNQHPDVYMSPIKEPHHFCKDIRYENFSRKYKKSVCFDIKKYFENTTLEKKHIAFIENMEEYAQLFRELENEKIIGEISTGYLYSKVAAKEIYKFNPGAKIVMVLRNPIDRAFSHWMMDLYGDDVCRSSFLEAIRKDLDKAEKGWGKNHLYVELGLYYKQVKRYLDVFPKEQVLVLFYDDLSSDPFDFLKQLFEFLEIKPLSINVNQRYNSASIPRYPSLNRVMKKIHSNQLITKLLPGNVKGAIKNSLSKSDNLPKLKISDRTNTQGYFETDTMLLEELIGRNLSAWRLAK